MIGLFENVGSRRKSIQKMSYLTLAEIMLALFIRVLKESFEFCNSHALINPE